MELGADAVVILDSEDLEDHVGVIRRQVERSLRDRETHTLAKKIVAGRAESFIAAPDETAIPLVWAWGLPHQLAVDQAALEPAREPLDQIVAVWNFVVLNVAYQYDPVIGDTPEWCLTTRLTLDQRAGDCDDMVIVLASLLKALGFSVKARVVSTNQEAWQHIYAVVDHDGHELALDPVVRGAWPGFEYGGVTAHEDIPL
jgi:predicted transglutaminase-like cysteine proteinase